LGEDTVKRTGSKLGLGTIDRERSWGNTWGTETGWKGIGFLLKRENGGNPWTAKNTKKSAGAKTRPTAKRGLINAVTPAKPKGKGDRGSKIRKMPL